MTMIAKQAPDSHHEASNTLRLSAASYQLQLPREADEVQLECEIREE
jgi:hypothetical protein